MNNKWCGRIWKNQDLLKNFSKNMSILLDYQLAIEDYLLINNCANNTSIESVLKLLSDLRKQAKNITDEEEFEVYQESINVLKKFDSIIEALGKENFIQYEDGSIEYNHRGK